MDEGVGYNLRFIRTETWGFFWTKSIYEFTLNKETPLTLVTEEGYFQPDQHEMETDIGSIPPPLYNILPHDQYRLEYLFHDSITKHGGLWFCKVIDGVYGFKEISYARSNMLLKQLIALKSKFRSYLVLVGVFIGRLTKRKK